MEKQDHYFVATENGAAGEAMMHHRRDTGGSIMLECTESIVVTIDDCDVRFSWYDLEKSVKKPILRLELFADSLWMLRNCPLFCELAVMYEPSPDDIEKLLQMNNIAKIKLTD